MNLVVTPTLSSNRRGLTAEQAKAAYADSHVAVIAGAGTGKTHMLSERYLHLLMHHGFSPLEIVAVTFTRKAAAELRSRIRQTVTRALPDQPSYLAELEAARISTIDALAMRICEEHPEAAGVPADFTLLDDIEGQIRDQEYLEMALDQLPDRFYRQIPYSLIEAAMRIGLIDPLSAEKALSCDSSQWPVLVDRPRRHCCDRTTGSNQNRFWHRTAVKLTTSSKQPASRRFRQLQRLRMTIILAHISV
jgi:ATP-dependent helicase/nuclease subunit A